MFTVLFIEITSLTFHTSEKIKIVVKEAFSLYKQKFSGITGNLM